MDSFVEGLRDKFIDTAVDGAIDNIKAKNKLEKTYVWTAISRETHEGNTANFIFINTL